MLRCNPRRDGEEGEGRSGAAAGNDGNVKIARDTSRLFRDYNHLCSFTQRVNCSGPPGRCTAKIKSELALGVLIRFQISCAFRAPRPAAHRRREKCREVYIRTAAASISPPPPLTFEAETQNADGGCREREGRKSGRSTTRDLNRGEGRGRGETETGKQCERENGIPSPPSPTPQIFGISVARVLARFPCFFFFIHSRRRESYVYFAAFVVSYVEITARTVRSRSRRTWQKSRRSSRREKEMEKERRRERRIEPYGVHCVRARPSFARLVSLSLSPPVPPCHHHHHHPSASLSFARAPFMEPEHSIEGAA